MVEVLDDWRYCCFLEKCLLFFSREWLGWGGYVLYFWVCKFMFVIFFVNFVFYFVDFK